MSDKEKIEDLEKFFKEAFCIDGDCNFDGFNKVVMLENKTEEKLMSFKLSDSKRGNFKVHLSNG